MLHFNRATILSVVCAFTALCCAPLLQGQAPIYLSDQPGTWTTTYRNDSPGAPIGRPQVSAAELAALRTALTTIDQLVHDTPMLIAPRGFDVRAWHRLDRGCPRQPVLCGQTPMPGWIDVVFEPFYKGPDGKVAIMRASPPDVEIAFNDPSASYVGHESAGLKDPTGKMMIGPLIEVERVGTVAILDTGVVILGRNPRPMFIPASREQYLRAVIAQTLSTSPRVPEDLRAELAALTPESRHLPAFMDLGGGAYSGLVAAPSYEKAPPLFMFNSDELAALSSEQRRATPLFIFNPEYFDSALPRTAIQLITVRFLGARDTTLEGVRLGLQDRPDLLERSPLNPERLAFLNSSGTGVTAYRAFELTRALNYAALSALLAAPTPTVR